MASHLHEPVGLTARAQGYVGCRLCGRLASPGETRCTRCHSRIESRDTLSLQRVSAWLIAGLVAYVPANLYPMLRTTQAFETTESTIVGGVVDLIQYQAYAIAGIVFFASVAIPVGKFIVIAYLAWTLNRPGHVDQHRLHRLHEVVEFIGRWSMIDVFVVAILAALVQFDVIATIQPGIAAICFALSVIFTMLSAQALDPRLIWDRVSNEGSHAGH